MAVHLYVEVCMYLCIRAGGVHLTNSTKYCYVVDGYGCCVVNRHCYFLFCRIVVCTVNAINNFIFIMGTAILDFYLRSLI
jgi:hypothetical protein